MASVNHIGPVSPVDLIDNKTKMRNAKAKIEYDDRLANEIQAWWVASKASMIEKTQVDLTEIIDETSQLSSQLLGGMLYGVLSIRCTLLDVLYWRVSNFLHRWPNVLTVLSSLLQRPTKSWPSLKSLKAPSRRSEKERRTTCTTTTTITPTILTTATLE